MYNEGFFKIKDNLVENKEKIYLQSVALLKKEF